MSNKKSLKKNKGERERLRLKKEKERLDLEEQEMIESGKSEVENGKDVTDDAPHDDSEELEKGYHDEMKPMMEMENMSMPGPTSFDELDEMRETEEKAEHVRHVTWDVQDLVRNILHDSELVPTEKADRIMDVADGFAQRVNAMLDGEEHDMKKDLEVLQIEAILGSYERHLSILEKARDWSEDQLMKRKLSYGARKRLEESDFALPGKRKYPIHDKAHVRNALARAAQQIKAGGQGAADAKAALPKIRAAAKHMGIEMGMEKSAFLIEKDKNNDWRWIGKPSNNFIDSQNDIISKSAHEKYVAWLEKNMDVAPVFAHWHIPGTARENPADFAMEHEGVLIMSGKLTEFEASALLKMQSKIDLGMSLQGFGLRLDPSDPRVITDYWLYEVSDLPLEKAANPFTSLDTITKEAGMDKLQYLTEMMGSEERAKAFLEKTGQMQKQLQQAGITSKENEPAVEQPKTETQPQAQTQTPPVDVSELTKQLIAAVGKEFDMQGLSDTMAKVQENLDKIPLLESLVKDLQKNTDDKLAEKLEPPAARFSWSMEKRPSTSTDTLLKDTEEDKNLKKAGPGVPEGYWLSELTGTVPVQE